MLMQRALSLLFFSISRERISPHPITPWVLSYAHHVVLQVMPLCADVHGLPLRSPNFALHHPNLEHPLRVFQPWDNVSWDH